MPRFVDAIADGITSMLWRSRGPTDRADLAARLTPHSWAAVFARYERIYRELLSKATGLGDVRTSSG